MVPLGGFAQSRDAKLRQGKIDFSALFAASAS
jgi:hypothetical protein